MDFDLLPELLREAPIPSSSNQLLNDLTSSRLTNKAGSKDHDHYHQFTSTDQASHSENTSLPTSTSMQSEKLDPETSTIISYQTGFAITKIEEICEAMTDCIIGRRNQFSICLKSRNVQATDDKNKPPTSRGRKVQFPSSSPQEAWKFSRFEAVSHAS